MTSCQDRMSSLLKIDLNRNSKGIGLIGLTFTSESLACEIKQNYFENKIQMYTW